MLYAQDLYEGISTQMKSAHPLEHKAIASTMSELSKATPSVIPPSAPTKTLEEVNKLVNTIEQNSQKIIKS